MTSLFDTKKHYITTLQLQNMLALSSVISENGPTMAVIQDTNYIQFLPWLNKKWTIHLRMSYDD